MSEKQKPVKVNVITVDVQSKPANSPDGIKSENESATLLQALNKVSTQVYVEKTETSESQRDGCDVQSKPSLPDGIKSENESATLLQALNKVSTQVYVEKTETSESQRDDCDVQSKPSLPDGIKSGKRISHPLTSVKQSFHPVLCRKNRNQ